MVKYFISTLLCVSALTAQASEFSKTDAFIESAGEILQVALPLTALTATYTLDDGEGRKALLWSYGSALAITALSNSLQDNPPTQLSSGFNALSYQTQSAFSGASFMAKRYGWDIGVPAYLTASFVGFSRVHGEHNSWLDVTASAALAIGINEWVLGRFDQIHVAVDPSLQSAQLSYRVRY